MPAPCLLVQTVRATYQQESSGGLGTGRGDGAGPHGPSCVSHKPYDLLCALCLPQPRPTPPLFSVALAAGKVPRYSFVHSFGRLAREQGLLALWRGNTPYLLRHVPSISMSFAFKVRPWQAASFVRPCFGGGTVSCCSVSLFWGREDRPAWQAGVPARGADLQSN